jgi:hypothetical protein
VEEFEEWQISVATDCLSYKLIPNLAGEFPPVYKFVKIRRALKIKSGRVMVPKLSLGWHSFNYLAGAILRSGEWSAAEGSPA